MCIASAASEVNHNLRGAVAAQDAAHLMILSAPAAQQLQHQPQLDGVVAVYGGRQRARQHLQHVRLRGQRLDVADVRRRQARRRCRACADTQPQALGGSVSSRSADTEQRLTCYRACSRRSTCSSKPERALQCTCAGQGRNEMSRLAGSTAGAVSLLPAPPVVPSIKAPCAQSERKHSGGRCHNPEGAPLSRTSCRALHATSSERNTPLTEPTARGGTAR